MRKKTNCTTASKRAHTNSTQMETSSRMGRTSRKASRSKTSRAKNCGK